MRKKIINIIILVLLVYGGYFLYKRYYTVHDVKWDSVIIERDQKLTDYIHPPSIIHFYASWCGPCMKELPELINYITTSNTPYELILITDDSEDKIDIVKKKYPGDYSIYRVNSLKENDIYTIPVSYVLDENLEIKQTILGQMNWSEFEQGQK